MVMCIVVASQTLRRSYRKTRVIKEVRAAMASGSLHV